MQWRAEQHENANPFMSHVSAFRAADRQPQK
jgi:hypothetical protein